MEMFFGQGHGGVKADDREFARHVQNGLNDGFSHFRVEVVQLGGVIPGHEVPSLP